MGFFVSISRCLADDCLGGEGSAIGWFQEEAHSQFSVMRQLSVNEGPTHITLITSPTPNQLSYFVPTVV